MLFILSSPQYYISQKNEQKLYCTRNGMPKYNANVARTGLCWTYLPFQNVNSDVQFCQSPVLERLLTTCPVPVAIGVLFQIYDCDRFPICKIIMAHLFSSAPCKFFWSGSALIGFCWFMCYFVLYLLAPHQLNNILLSFLGFTGPCQHLAVKGLPTSQHMAK